MMKKWGALLLTLLLSVSLVSCGSGGQKGTNEGRIGDTLHTYFFDYTVNSAYTCQEFSGYTADENCKLLIVEVTVKNTFENSVEMYDIDFQAEWNAEGDGENYRIPVTTDPDTNEEFEPLSDEQLPGTYELAVDEERTGLLVYQVPSDVQDFCIAYLESFDDNTTGESFGVFFTPEETSAA